MKKITLFCFIVFLSIGAFSQNYIPIDTNDTQWNYRKNFGNIGMGSCQEYSYYISGDTLIGPQAYFKLFKVGVNYKNDIGFPCDYHTIWGTFDSLNMLIRNDTANKKVYIYDAPNQKEEILFDFDLKVGDTLKDTYFHLSEFYVDSINTDSLAGKNRKVFHLRPDGFGSSLSSTTLIEGIGYLDGDFETLNNMVTVIRLLCYSEGVDTYPKNKSCNLITKVAEYTAKNEVFHLYPNPTSGIVRLENVENLQNISVYNLQGRKVQEINPKERSWELPEEKGLYLIRLQDKKGSFYSEKVIKN